ncbi:MAG: hypothetical protein JOZ29_01365 [Deltaproteobacteria bacterium]|nr:hypothetical protein [Deltaproteobacteria bacterium]
MAGDEGSRRFVVLWWVIAFMAGILTGVLAVTSFGATDTIWCLIGFGVPIAGVIAALEWFGQRRRGVRTSRRQWRHPPRVNATPARKATKGRLPLGRGQLHAITGRKTADPPSSSSPS